MAIGRLHHVIVDCPEPLALATFYSALLGLPVTYHDDDFAVVAAPPPPLDPPESAWHDAAPSTGTATNPASAICTDQSFSSAAMSVMSTSLARNSAVCTAKPIAISTAISVTATSTTTWPSGRAGDT